jgi:hypothetical protein
MKRQWMVMGATAVLALSACGTNAPRSQAELQQERAEARADSARAVANTHEAANKEVRQAEKALRGAEDEAAKREARARESRVQESEARTRADAAPGEARERIRTAEVESEYLRERQTCEALAEDARASCLAAAEQRLNNR